MTVRHTTRRGGAFFVLHHVTCIATELGHIGVLYSLSRIPANLAYWSGNGC